jgi:glycosyltransferase involved in cell wall biosynthesis
LGTQFTKKEFNDNMTIYGMLRIKNESRWIVQVLKSILPICERIWILDDGSQDGTPELCEQLSPQITVIRSAFEGFDESRDREYLLSRLLGSVSDIHLRGDEKSPFWALAIDGDEILDERAAPHIYHAIQGPTHAYKLPIYYLWDSDMSLWPFRQHRIIRTDGVYKTFARPSLFRLFNKEFRFQRTPWGGNFHCSSIPQQLLHHAHGIITGAPLWHLGYNDKDDRVRKYLWYNEMDPGNASEDCYKHMVIGDLFPANSRFLHAGPLVTGPAEPICD